MYRLSSDLYTSDNAISHLRYVREKPQDISIHGLLLCRICSNQLNDHFQGYGFRTSYVYISLWLLRSADSNNQAIPDPTMGLFRIRLCVPLDLSKLYKLFWIPLLSFEVILFALALYKGLGYLRMYKIGAKPGPLTLLLFRDSVIYFVM